MSSIRVLVSLLSLVALSACSAPVPSPPEGSEPRLLVRLESVGGLLPPGASFAHLPSLSIFSDGWAYAPAPTAAVFPGPLVQPLQRFRVSPESLEELEARAEALGLLSGPLEYGIPPVADAGATVVTLCFEECVTHSAEALEVPGPGGMPAGTLSAVELDRRARLLEFREALSALEGRDASIWEPSAYRVSALPAEVVVSEPSMVVPWPLEDVDPALLAASNGAESVVVDGREATDLSAVLLASDALTVFQAGEVRYALLVRPLLPDEV